MGRGEWSGSEWGEVSGEGRVGRGGVSGEGRGEWRGEWGGGGAHVLFHWFNSMFITRLFLP